MVKGHVRRIRYNQLCQFFSLNLSMWGSLRLPINMIMIFIVLPIRQSGRVWS